MSRKNKKQPPPTPTPAPEEWDPTATSTVATAPAPDAEGPPRGVLLEEVPHDVVPLPVQLDPVDPEAPLPEGPESASAECAECRGVGALVHGGEDPADPAYRAVLACEPCRGSGRAGGADVLTPAALAARQAAELRTRLAEAQTATSTKKDWGRTWYESFQGAKKEMLAQTERADAAERRVKELEALLASQPGAPAPKPAVTPDVDARVAAAEKRAREAEAKLADVERVVAQKVAAQFAAQAHAAPAAAPEPAPPAPAPAPALVTSSEPLNKMLDAGRQVVQSHGARATQFVKNSALANLAKTLVEVEGLIRTGGG
jgi:hypothetical protein